MTKLKNRKDNKQLLLLCIAFLILLSSYTVNLWKVTPSALFHGFERAPEGLVVGRLIKAEKDGIFSDGGLTGVAYDADSLLSKNESVNRAQLLQHYYFLTNRTAPLLFAAYKSQPGGQGIVYSAIQKISPFDNASNIQIFRLLNSALTAFCFILFIAWSYRNFGFKASLVTFLLLLFSPWINNYAHNLWWSFWNFFLPFLCMLLLLEKKHRNAKSITNRKIFGLLFLAVFVKCIFSGFEFVTTTMLAIICPVVYYYFLQKESFWTFFKFSFKAGVASALAVVTSMFILIMQIRSLSGNFMNGVNHILSSYTKRTTQETILDNKPSLSLHEVLQKYFSGNAFELSYFSNTNFEFHFGFLVTLILVFCVVIYLRDKNADRKNKALIITGLFSILCPLSWFVIFKQHASEHPHLDYIVWYIPFLLFGFLIIGQALSLLTSKKRN